MAYLEDTPYRIDIAETGLIACEMFKAGHYDLVLMDRQMPVMDGLTATRMLRAWEKVNDRPPTPIIALTASALKGRSGNLPGGGLHGLSDQADQAGRAAAGDPGLFRARAAAAAQGGGGGSQDGAVGREDWRNSFPPIWKTAGTMSS